MELSSAVCRRLWPNVDPYPILRVLGTDPVLDGLGSREPRAAATSLMEPVAQRLSGSDEMDALHALDALVRAGGDPRRVLPRVAAELKRSRFRSAAAKVLVRAALGGASLVEVVDTLDRAPSDEWVERARRLAKLEHRPGVVAKLAVAYANQVPMGDLHGAIGLLERQLLAGGGDEVLEELLAAGRDRYRCWRAMIPSMVWGLAAEPDEAARAMGKVRFLSPPADDVREVGQPLVGPIVARLWDTVEAAETLEVLVRLGCSLDGTTDAVDAARSHPSVGVRSACSRALTRHRVREGLEEEAMPGLSRRRVYAPSEAPLEGVTVCRACGGKAEILYRNEDASQVHVDGLAEWRCTLCGSYGEDRWGYG